MSTLPTLFRMIIIVALLVGAVYAGMFALANFVQPTLRPMEQTIPAAKLK